MDATRRATAPSRDVAASAERSRASTYILCACACTALVATQSATSPTRECAVSAVCVRMPAVTGPPQPREMCVISALTGLVLSTHTRNTGEIHFPRIAAARAGTVTIPTLAGWPTPRAHATARLALGLRGARRVAPSACISLALHDCVAGQRYRSRHVRTRLSPSHCWPSCATCAGAKRRRCRWCRTPAPAPGRAEAGGRRGLVRPLAQ
mmetsp:Transcript_39432/g.117781  ORF Transcript_39432/g.117781 Transcript_39432/m.117781 type:complete len:209 (-) Transcript_39432:1293-1919(-)